MLPRQDSAWLQGTVSDSKQSYHHKYELCKRPTLVQKWASWKNYHKQDDGKDLYQSRVIRAVHESLHLRIDVSSLFQFQHGADERKICAITKHKDERSLTHYINETTSAQKKECSKILRDTFQPQLAVQQEASGITRQNSARSSAGPSSNSTKIAPNIFRMEQWTFITESKKNRRYPPENAADNRER